MKISKLFLSALLAIFFIACSNEDDSVPAPDVRSVSVSLNGLSSNSTRASDPTEIITASTKNVNSVLINLTTSTGVVVVSKTITKDNVLDSDWDKLVTPNKGLKFINTSENIAKVYVYGNPGTAVDVNNIINTTLADQQGSEVLYYGVDEDLTPIVTEPINPDPTTGITYTANVTITPIVARLQVKNITIKNSGSFIYKREINNVDRSATVSWTAFTAKLKGIYLNNFYYTYTKPGTLTNLSSLSTYTDAMIDGKWLFTPPGPTMDAASFASYIKYANGTYSDLPLSTPNKCYAFNFFPGLEIPKMHLDLSNIVVTGLTSTDVDVFNPALSNTFRFANVVKYLNSGGAEMTGLDFKPGTLYNMDIELVPALDSDLKNMQYNILVHVTIAPWAEETLTPGLDIN